MILICTGKSAFFQNQLLIERALPGFQRFVANGDSGSLAVDRKQNAIGSIFAGTSDAPDLTPARAKSVATLAPGPTTDKPRRIEGYGVANPISEVLDRLKIQLPV